jgi:hypothetical protein
VAAADTPQEIIKNSFDVMARSSFHAETYEKGIKGTVYHRTNPDGTADVRTEYSMSQPLNGQIDTNWMFVMLQNRDGMWKLRPDAALRMDYLTKKSTAISATRPTDKLKPDDYDYTITENDENGIPCYLIRAVIHEAARTRVLDELKSDGSLNKLVMVSQIMDKFPVEVKYRIGKADSFMYSNETFSKDGKKFSGIEYTNVVQAAVMPDDLFQVPSNLKVRILNTKEESKQFVMSSGVDGPHFQKRANPASKKVVVIFCLLMSLPLLFFLIRSKGNSSAAKPSNL